MSGGTLELERWRDLSGKVTRRLQVGGLVRARLRWPEGSKTVNGREGKKRKRE